MHADGKIAAYPTSNQKAKDTNWDGIHKEVVKEEENEQPGGDAGLQKLFQKIYADADEVRPALPYLSP